jgi:hypothetical protein
MSNFFDDLLTGHLSRRQVVKAFAAVPAMETAAAQIKQAEKEKKQARRKEGAIYSPENIGGGGRIERNFYREWTKTSKVPMVEGYSIMDAKTQEVHPWPEIGGNGVYLNFSGNVHMDGAIMEIPNRKALLQSRKFYEQLVVCLAGRGTTTIGNPPHTNKVEWGERKPVLDSDERHAPAQKRRFAASRALACDHDVPAFSELIREPGVDHGFEFFVQRSLRRLA